MQDWKFWQYRKVAIDCIAFSLCKRDPSLGGWRARIAAAKTFDERHPGQTLTTPLNFGA